MADFVASLEQPRRVIIMVKAGAPTDAVIDELVPLLEEGDIIIDAGNAHFPTPSVGRTTSRPRACTSSAPASPVARRVR